MRVGTRRMVQGELVHGETVQGESVQGESAPNSTYQQTNGLHQAVKKTFSCRPANIKQNVTIFILWSTVNTSAKDKYVLHRLIIK